MNNYMVPMVDLSDVHVEEHPGPVWVITVLSWGSVLWAAWHCRRIGGSPRLGWSWGRFRVYCNR